MKYVGRLVLLAQTTLIAGWLNAGTVTVNGLNCGSTVGNVTISASGDITVDTNDQTSCAPGTSTPGGPYTVTGNRGGTGTLGVVTGTGIDCGGAGDCAESIESGGSITLTATPPSGTDTFSWSGACTGTSPTCTISNITTNKLVTATYNAAATPTDCPSGVTCSEQAWPVIPQTTLTMKATAVYAYKVNTTAAGLTGSVTTTHTTGATAYRIVSLSTVPGDFSGGSACVKEGLEVTSINWIQGGSALRKCTIPANSTAWINVKFTNCGSTSCSYKLSAY